MPITLKTVFTDFLLGTQSNTHILDMENMKLRFEHFKSTDDYSHPIACFSSSMPAILLTNTHLKKLGFVTVLLQKNMQQRQHVFELKAIYLEADVINGTRMNE